MEQRSRPFVRFNEINEDILLLIAGLLGNRELLCLALTFSHTFRLSNFRYYWKQTPSDFNFERLADWEEYTGEEIRRASIRAYRSFHNWASPRPRVKRHVTWKEQHLLWPVPHSRWFIRLDQKAGKVSFFDVMTQKATSFLRLPTLKGLGFSQIEYCSASAPNQVQFGLKGRDRIHCFCGIITHKRFNRLEAAISERASIQVPTPLFQIPRSYQMGYNHVTVLRYTGELAARTHELCAIDVRTHAMHRWKVNGSVVRRHTHGDWLLVVIRSKILIDSIGLAVIDLSKLHSKPGSEALDLPTVELYSRLSAHLNADASISGSNGNYAIRLTVEGSHQQNQTQAFTITCDDSAGIYPYVRIQPWGPCPGSTHATTYENKNILYAVDWSPSRVYGWHFLMGSPTWNTAATFYQLDKAGDSSSQQLQMSEMHETLGSILKFDPYTQVPLIEPEVMLAYFYATKTVKGTHCHLYRF